MENQVSIASDFERKFFKMDNNVKPKTRILLIYFVLIGVLSPRGFSQYLPVYKDFFSVWIWVATLLVWTQYLFFYLNDNSIKLNSRNLKVTSYFVLTILITFISEHGFSQGLQQLFVFPTLCIFVVVNFKKNPAMFMNAFVNISMIIIVSNLVIFRGFFSNKFHLTFIGHVQMISQVGTLILFMSILYWWMFHEHRAKLYLLSFLTLITMITTDADSAVISAIFWIIAILYYKSNHSRLLTFKGNRYVFFFLIVNFLVIGITVWNTNLGNIVPGLSFSGRNFVWQNALQLFSRKPILGYGIEGVLIQTFWTTWTGGGFNYAHNEVIQNLLDGGTILFISFWVMMLTIVKGFQRIISKKYRLLLNICLCSFLFIMIFDSPGVYCYLYIYLAISLELPNVLETTSKKISQND